jgi:hypothetical protein
MKTDQLVQRLKVDKAWDTVTPRQHGDLLGLLFSLTKEERLKSFTTKKKQMNKQKHILGSIIFIFSLMHGQLHNNKCSFQD